MGKLSSTEHEKLFDEICGQLQELAPRKDTSARLKIEELLAAQSELEQKVKAFDQFDFVQTETTEEFQKMNLALQEERTTNSKLSTDLAKSLELNLKLQFEIEEIRSRAYAALNEERRLGQILVEKNRTLTHELDLAQAVGNEVKIELVRAKDKLQIDQEKAKAQETLLKSQITDLESTLDSQCKQTEVLENEKRDFKNQLSEISKSFQTLEEYTLKQNEMMNELSAVAEKKLIELKMALDKKNLEYQNLTSQYQQAQHQLTIFRQENTALKDYIHKLINLHQQVDRQI